MVCGLHGKSKVWVEMSDEIMHVWHKEKGKFRSCMRYERSQLTATAIRFLLGVSPDSVESVMVMTRFS